MIKLTLIGNLGKDCVVNNPNGRTVINFNVAHSERYTDASGTQRERTIWVDCSYWTEKTAVAQYLKKGQQVYVEGQPDVRAYKTADGRDGASLTLRVAQVQLLGSANRSENEGYAPTPQPMEAAVQQASTMPAAAVTAPVDDLPF
jgi:single-strand DNA-binding protein